MSLEAVNMDKYQWTQLVESTDQNTYKYHTIAQNMLSVLGARVTSSIIQLLSL